MDIKAINLIKCNRLELSEPNSHLIISAMTDIDGTRSLTESRFHNPSVKILGNQTLLEQITAFSKIGHIRTRQWTYDRFKDIFTVAENSSLLNEALISKIKFLQHKKIFSLEKIFSQKPGRKFFSS